MAAWTRKTLRQRIGEAAYCGDVILATATADGAANAMTLICTNLADTDDAYNYGSVFVTSGNAATNERIVTDWVQSTSTITVDRACSVQITTNTTFEVHRLFSPTQKHEAIKAAIRQSKTRWARPVEDETITMLDNTYIYSLANTTVAVDPVWLIDRVLYDTGDTTTGYPFEELPASQWEVRDVNGVLTLQLYGEVPNSGYKFRLVYRARPVALTDDTTGLNPDIEAFAEFICAKAAQMLFEWKDTTEGGDTVWKKKALGFQAIADGIATTDRLPTPSRQAIFGRAGADDLLISSSWSARVRI